MHRQMYGIDLIDLGPHILAIGRQKQEGCCQPVNPHILGLSHLNKTAGTVTDCFGCRSRFDRALPFLSPHRSSMDGAGAADAPPPAALTSPSKSSLSLRNGEPNLDADGIPIKGKVRGERGVQPHPLLLLASSQLLATAIPATATVCRHIDRAHTHTSTLLRSPGAPSSNNRVDSHPWPCSPDWLHCTVT